MIIEMTPEFQRALELLESGSNLFLTGKAGTGKSTLIRHFLKHTRRRAVVAAPTAVAALNVGGYTLHRLFSFPAKVTVEAVLDGTVTPARFRSTIAKLDTLIIDEASMVRADLFDCVAHALRQYGPNPSTSFGGVQVVLVGDLFQLPPVVTDTEYEYFTTTYDTPYFFSAHTYDTTSFPTIHLSKVFRQAGDQTLVEVLNAIRDGKASHAVRRTINAKVDPEFLPPPDEFWLTMATTNRNAAAYNHRSLAQLDGEEFTAYAHLDGELDQFSFPTDPELKFKVGAQIMMLNNDASGRWVNGSLGRVTAVDYSYEDGWLVKVELRTGATVEVTEHEWEITRPHLEFGMLKHRVIGSFTQLPFKLAWAITIHKSQGQTVDRAVVDLAGAPLTSGQLYVALSRCTSLDGLVLKRAVSARHVKVDHRVRHFLADATGSAAQQYCAVEVLTVANADGGFARPIDIAVAVEDGTVLDTLINPQRDLADAAARYGIHAADLQLAPTLSQAWPFVEDEIEGLGLVSRDGPTLVQLLDGELKRTGLISGIDDVARPAGNCSPPVGRDEHPSGNASTLTISARERALATIRAVHDGGVSERVNAYARLDRPGVGYRMGRDFRIVPYGDPQEVADLLTAKISSLRLSPRSEEILKQFETEFRVSVTRPEVAHQLTIEQVLCEGARVCFTGTVVHSSRVIERTQMEALAVDVGLLPVRSVTKTRCEALIAADVSSQSGKARKALQFDKPIFSATQFLDWVTAAGGGVAPTN